jgi:3-deoxy-D-manno-octulosonic-acid transferase
VAFVGGSLVRHGGQNPLEPARLGCPVLLGPHCWNFAEAVARLLAAGAAVQLPDPAIEPGALAAAALDVLTIPGRGEKMAEAAAATIAPQTSLPGQVAAALLELLPEPGRG